MRTLAISSRAVAFLFALGLAACASQGEGDRCDRTNGNDDCESGLRCTPQAAINGADTRASICCPDGRAATVDACRATNVGGSTGTGGSSTSSGGSTTEDGAVGSGGASGGDGAVSSGGTSSDASPGSSPDGAIDGAP